jgi:hypothetical protein
LAPTPTHNADPIAKRIIVEDPDNGLFVDFGYDEDFENELEKEFDGVLDDIEPVSREHFDETRGHTEGDLERRFLSENDLGPIHCEIL